MVELRASGPVQGAHVRMKCRPRLCVDLLPTISERHEDISPESCRTPASAARPLEEYLSSIKELAQPTSLSACPPRPGTGPLRGPPGQRSATARPPRRPAWASRPLSSVCLEEVTLKFGSQDSCQVPSTARDPLDWLYAQSQYDDSSARDNFGGALFLL
ncbi:protein DEPP-like [Lepisosteus oculatus]|uniref:protein DEPP-like n=1 Tax=Lepisosteus oculatus TaxID=7918 RepID=UPI00371AACCE